MEALRNFLLFMVMGPIAAFAISGCVTTEPALPGIEQEPLTFESANNARSVSVVASIYVPQNKTSSLPLIITQHGSSRDGLTFADGNGQTDEYSSRLIQQGTKSGFAVVAIDAFAGTSVTPNSKTRFPDAYRYAVDLKNVLAADRRFDPKNVFYTGFSFGADQVNKAYDARYKFQGAEWKAVAAAEPGCNVIPKPTGRSFPILIIKGSESHYHTQPCRYFEKLLRKAGNTATLFEIKGANHFFSSNGTITKGVAVNGCFDNPVIRQPDGSFRFASGEGATREEVISRCFTEQAGLGKNREYLDNVIQMVLAYFGDQLGKR
jgi:dienelactone hydrolase